MKMLYEYGDEGDIPYSGGFYFWSEWLFRYYNKLPLGESIEIYHLMWKS